MLSKQSVSSTIFGKESLLKESVMCISLTVLKIYLSEDGPYLENLLRFAKIVMWSAVQGLFSFVNHCKSSVNYLTASF